MALNRGRLTNNVIAVPSGTTTGIVTVASNKKIYVKSIMVHNTSGVTTAQSAIHYVANGESVGAGTSLFNLTVEPNETVFVEPTYPIVLTTTGDGMSVTSTDATTNYFFTGDVEA